MTTTIELAVVRIRAPDGRTVGAGFLVADRQVLTCAHVVAAALGLPEDTPETPQAEVHLDFPLVAPGSILTARAIHWQPESDVAGLQLEGDPPAAARPVCLVTAKDLWGHAFRAFGFPSGYDDGVWASGVLRGRQAASWVQIEDVKEPGYWVQPGFSGTAVWDEQLNGVVGMAIAADRDKTVKAAFIIPTDVLVKAWSILSERVSSSAPSAPFMVEDLPDDFVPRPGESEPLLAYLLDEGNSEPVAFTAALRGAGGYGKTTLARALCHDPRIRQAYPDGILWVTLGESPDVLAGLTKVYAALTGERLNFVDVEDAASTLAQTWKTRRCLLVIDDVWNEAHLRPFLRGGERCARLITTRDRATLLPNTKQVDVDAMQQAEAVELLGASFPIDDMEANLETLNQLAFRLGKWPLLLKLVNGTLRDRVHNIGQPLPNALSYINRAMDRRGLTAFDAQDSVERHQAVTRTLSVSLELLSEDERTRYGELAIFPDDVDIPLVTLEKLWGDTGGLDDFDTEELCSRLYRLSLLLHWDPIARTIRLHDVVRKYLAQEQSERLLTLHDQLLDAHAADLPLSPASIPQWADLPHDEPYLWDHLARHLAGAGRGAELVVTVKDLRYLAIKTYVCGAYAAELDLLVAEKQSRNDALLRQLRRAFAQAGHLLNQCERVNDLAATLHSRLQHLTDLASLTQRFAQTLSSSYLTPWHSLPDLPSPALLRTLAGHEGPVWSCAINRNGSVIVSASFTLKIWDAHSGVEYLALPGHGEPAWNCAISTDGSIIVSASGDKTLKVWDAHSGDERLTLAGHSAPVLGCAISTDGSIIVSASGDKTLKVWDAHSGDERLTLTGHQSVVRRCAISCDGGFIVSASDDKTLKVWDAHSGKEYLTLIGHTDIVSSCAISSDDSIIVSASGDKTLKVWDAHSGDERLTLTGHKDAVWDCAISHDGDFIVSASLDHTLKVWDTKSGVERLTLEGHKDFVLGCVVGPNDLIISASADGTLKVWEVAEGSSGTMHLTTNEHTNEVRSCAVSADGAVVISTSYDKTLKMWDAHSGTVRRTLIGHESEVRGCAISADGSIIVSASDDKTLKVWDAHNGTVRRTLIGHEGAVRGCAISADSSIIVSASDDKTLKVWDAHSGTVRRTLIGHEDTVNGCAIGADGSIIVSASDDKTLKVWDAHSGTARRTLIGHEGAVNGCAISADGSIIVSASSDKTLKVWDAHSGVEKLTLTGHMAYLSGCAISPDGTFIVSISADGTLKVWDVSRGHCLATLLVDGKLYDCTWFPDGQHIAAVGGGGVYFLWLVR